MATDLNFYIRNITQSSPLADVENIISVNLRPSVSLRWLDRSSITISGILNGINLNSGNVLSLEGRDANLFSPFPDGTTSGNALYVGSVLTLYLAQNQSMVKDQDYAFRFRLINPRLNQPGGNTSISAISSQGSLARIYPQQMTFSADSTVVGVVDGAIPPKCIIPIFHGSSTIQSNPLVG